MPYDKPTHAAHMREWRKTHPMSEEQRRKDRARSYAKVYLRRGLITKQDCEVCGGPAQMHHPDYDRPLDVLWVCEKHHRDIHDWPMFLAAARKPDSGEDDNRGVDRECA